MSFKGGQQAQFSLPVCTAFRKKIFYDQLCYEADLDLYKESLSLKDFKVGFSFLVDLNNNRQISSLIAEEEDRVSGNQSLGRKC